MDQSKDLAFLREISGRLAKGRDGDPTQLEYVAEMVEHWIDELTLSAVTQPSLRSDDGQAEGGAA